MNKGFLNYVIGFLLFFILIGLTSCGQGEVISNDEKITIEDTVTKDDFEVTVTVTKNKDIEFCATVIYIGEEDEITVYRGGKFFYFNIYQEDGDFTFHGAMNLPSVRVQLLNNEPQREVFNELELCTLEPGRYEFEALAVLSKGSMDPEIRIPVSVTVDI